MNELVDGGRRLLLAAAAVLLIAGFGFLLWRLRTPEPAVLVRVGEFVQAQSVAGDPIFYMRGEKLPTGATAVCTVAYRSVRGQRTKPGGLVLIVDRTPILEETRAKLWRDRLEAESRRRRAAGEEWFGEQLELLGSLELSQ